MTPGENWNILGYKGPNGIPKDVLEIARTIHSVIQISDLEDEPMRRGIPYNFTVLNSSATGHLGKRIINPNWWYQFWWNLWCWIRDMLGYLSEKFQIQRISNFGDITETVTGISVEEIGKLGLPVPGASLHYFQKRSTLDSSIWRDIYVYPIISGRFQVLKIRVSVTNPRWASYGTRIDTSNR